jgi:SAM-dependent methyltransferase
MSDQQRWDQYGADRLAAIEADPGRFVVTKPQYAQMPFVQGLVAAIGPVDGQRVLELGCGYGQLSVYLAKQGARVTGVDVGPNLVAAARRLAEVDAVSADFDVLDIKTLPFESASADLVVGLAVLHHLSEENLTAALAETHRVLRPGGRALFTEPVEDSPRSTSCRTSCRSESAATRSTGRRGCGAPWRSVQFTPYGLTSRLERLLPERMRMALWSFDEAALRRLPPLRRFCRTVLVQYGR